MAVIGGGLAGLAAAAALCERGFRVEVFEARRRLGGRAGSYWNPAASDDDSGAWIDHCQHVGMGCCTNLTDFCQRTGIAHAFRRYDTLHFIGPGGQRYDFRASRWLPAPLHLAPALMNLPYLSWGDRLAIARALLRLARESPLDTPDRPTIGEWLRRTRQSSAALEHFWEVVLVSALGESLDRASLPAARKVFVDGFLAAKGAYCIDVPTASLHELYDRRVAEWLRSRDTLLHCEAPVAHVGVAADGKVQVTFTASATRSFDYAVLAVPWRIAKRILDSKVLQAIPELHDPAEIEASPITGVHLWFDRAVTDLPHAVFVGRLSQWMFRREATEPAAPASDPRRHYYQVVISASRNLQGRNREDVVREVVDDLGILGPAARSAQLLDWRIVTEREAVFSVRPGCERLRPRQTTPFRHLALAGDWTATGWPATMEGAVRSGYLAAEAMLEAVGRPETISAPDLPRGWLARLLLPTT